MVEQAGVGREELLRGTPLDPADLAGDARIDFADFALLQARALDLTGDEALGLHIGERASEAAFDLVAHLIVHAPTLREGVELCLRFQRMFADDAELSLHEKDATAAIHMDFPRTSPRADRMHAEFVMAGLLRMIRALVGSRAVARAVRFEHARPDHHAEYARIFGGVERFRQKVTGIAFDADLLDRPQLHYQPELHEVLRSQAERKLDRLTRGVTLAERLKQHLVARSPLGQAPDMTSIARDLGMSERSLRRRLSEEGTSYKAIVNEAFGKAATWLLSDSKRTIQETAHAMGFSDPTAFHRAFKRWTGMTPKQYRERREG